MERILLGEDGTCTGCSRVVWAGEPVHCGSPRGSDCTDLCGGGLECVVLCDACFKHQTNALTAPP